MSFKPAISEISIYNEALALVPAGSVQSPDENSLEARECRRFYKGVVAKLLEQYHWNLATQRIALAAIDNDRSTEWSHAYAKPTNMAYPVMVIPPNGGGWSGWVTRNNSYFLPGIDRALLMQVGGTLYSQVSGAYLEYTSFDITEADFTALLKEVVVKELAAKVCVPITKDTTRAQTLASHAEFERQRAIAQDLNRNNPTYGNTPTETEIARGAGVGDMWTGNYPLDPVANPANTGT